MFANFFFKDLVEEKFSSRFSNFTETQKETIKKECLVFLATGLSEEDFNIKLKKTYKNSTKFMLF